MQLPLQGSCTYIMFGQSSSWLHLVVPWLPVKFGMAGSKTLLHAVFVRLLTTLNSPCLMLQVAGLFVGMVSLGFAVDRIGRKTGSIFTAVVMIIGESLELKESQPVVIWP